MAITWTYAPSSTPTYADVMALTTGSDTDQLVAYYVLAWRWFGLFIANTDPIGSTPEPQYGTSVMQFLPSDGGSPAFPLADGPLVIPQFSADPKLCWPVIDAKHVQITNDGLNGSGQIVVVSALNSTVTIDLGTWTPADADLAVAICKIALCAALSLTA